MFIEVSLGEVIDKLTILEIKKEKITDPVKLDNINKELKSIYNKIDSSTLETLRKEYMELKKINERLWSIEDILRIKESKQEFDTEFLLYTRLVYITNDKRAYVKYTINKKSNSNLCEEKDYAQY